jgi:hypothetical protein
MPSHIAQFYAAFQVPFTVAMDFLLPEWCVCFGQDKVFAVLMSMPEAPVHHHCNPMPRQHQIRPPWQSPLLQPEPESARMKALPNQNLRFGILAAYA